MGSRPQNPAGQSLPSQPATPLVSVIVNNYNHGDYLEQAIASALAQTYANVEVVVVDDGSTDDSREVIGRFDSRIVAVLKENGGQGSAFNAGLEHASGTVIMFLDSDDYLLSGAVERVVPEFGPGVAKVQFRLTVVDGEGRPTGEYPPPDAPLHRGDVRPLLVRRGVYSTAVCSGNAYARAAIEAIFPVPAKAFSYGADGYVNAAVPFFGEVRAIDERLGAYRIHGRNYSTMESSGLDVGLFHYFIRHQLATEQVIVERARASGYRARPGLMLHNAAHVEARLASLRLDPMSHPVPTDRRLELTMRGVVATWRYVDVSVVRRVADTASFLAVGLFPRSVASNVISWRYERASRPAAIRLAVSAINRLLRRGEH